MAQGGTKNKNKNRHNRKGFKSIGSQVGSDLGGHLSNLSKQGKLGNKYAKHFQNEKGNLTFSGLGNMLSGWLGGDAYANAMGQVTGKAVLKKDLHPNFVKRMNKLNLDVEKPEKSFKINIDTQRAIDGLKNEDVKNWLNKNLPKTIKDWRINHQMYYTPKIKVGDPRYTPQGTGSPKLDKNTERYLEWIAKANPEGKTISDYKKIYANNLKDGRHTLEQVMKMNPANTMSYYALLDDTVQDKKDTKTNTNNKGKMAFDWAKYGVTDARTGGSKSDIAHNIDRLYQTTVGRNSDSSGGDYWAKQIASGKDDYSTLMAGLTGSKEYKDRLAAKTANPNVTEAQLDSLPSAYVSPFHAGSGSAVAGWKPGDGPSASTASNYSDQTNKNVGQVNAAHNVIDSTGGVGTIGGVQGTGAISGPGQGQSPAAATGLTMDDLNKWWEGIDKSAWTGGGQQEKSSSKWDDFTSFMGALQPFFGGGGGYHYPSMGYGGYAPGGVAAANPYGNMMNFMNAFKSVGGSGGGSGSTLSSSSLTK